MLPEDDFLRKLPVVLQPTQRLCLEAIVVSADMLGIAYASMKEIVECYGSNFTKIGDPDRAALFMFAWTMIDEIHVLRCLVKNLVRGRDMDPLQVTFCDDYENATYLRNRMDHLHENLDNLSGRQGHHAPLLGALSYVLVEPKNIIEQGGGVAITGCTSITVTSGSSPFGRSAFSVINPAGRTVNAPTSLFRLEAFDRVVELEGAVTALRELISELSEDVEKQIRSAADDLAEKDGVPLETLLAPHETGKLVVGLAMTFGAPREASASE